MMDDLLHRLAERLETEHPEFRKTGYPLFACFSALDNPGWARFEILGEAVIAR
jgi:hypothetical protein